MQMAPSGDSSDKGHEIREFCLCLLDYTLAGKFIYPVAMEFLDQYKNQLNHY